MEDIINHALKLFVKVSTTKEFIIKATQNRLLIHYGIFIEGEALKKRLKVLKIKKTNSN
jgi:hypothetical protein